MESDRQIESIAASWQESLRRAVRSVEELLELVSLTREQLPELDLNPSFPLLVPREYIQRIEPSNPQDPLLIQILPLAQENQQVPGF